MEFLYIYASTINISYRVLRSVKIIYMELEFFVCHDENFYFIFLMQVLKKYVKVKI
jgi:hypothetical protein